MKRNSGLRDPSGEIGKAIKANTVPGIKIFEPETRHKDFVDTIKEQLTDDKKDNVTVIRLLDTGCVYGSIAYIEKNFGLRVRR